MAKPSKKFTDLPPRQRLIASGVMLISISLVVAAERDLSHRKPPELRGNKLLWRVLCLNALGAIAYFRWGLRPAGA
jgi:hypothetical protein